MLDPERRKQLNELISETAKIVGEEYQQETGASKGESSFAAALLMLKEYRKAHKVNLPQLDEAEKILEEGMRQAQIRQANRDERDRQN